MNHRRKKQKNQCDKGTRSLPVASHRNYLWRHPEKAPPRVGRIPGSSHAPKRVWHYPLLPWFDLLLVSYFAWTTKALLILWTIGPLSTLPLSLYQLPASMGLFAQPEQLFSRPSVFSIVRHFLIGRSSVIRYTQCPFFITMVPSGHPGDRWSSIMSTKN